MAVRYDGVWDEGVFADVDTTMAQQRWFDAVMEQTVTVTGLGWIGLD